MRVISTASTAQHRLKQQSRRKLKACNDLAGLSSYPLFLQRQWFQPEIAGALRGHIRTLILELFISQASAMVRVPLVKLPLNLTPRTA